MEMDINKQSYVKADPYFAHIVVNNRKVQIILGTGEIYTITRLHEGSLQFLLMDHLMRPSKQRETQFLKHIPELKDIKPSVNLSEILRECGLNKDLKQAFFQKCIKDRVWFDPFTCLNAKQILALKKQAEVYEKS